MSSAMAEVELKFKRRMQLCTEAEIAQQC